MKFALDTNVFVDAFCDETVAEALAGFLEQALPSTFLSAVVVQELVADCWRTSLRARVSQRFMQMRHWRMMLCWRRPAGNPA
jgi:predicted nucleic acid-binding protein